MNGLTGTAQFDRIPWIDFKNVGTETIPPHGIIEIEDSQTDDSDTVEYLKCKRPTSHYVRFAINGPQEVAANDYGVCTLSVVCYAKINTSSVPVVGEILGPQKDSFVLQHSHYGVKVVGDINTGSSGLAYVRFIPDTIPTVRFQNISGEAVPYGSVMAVSATDKTADGEGIFFKIVKPTTDLYQLVLVNVSGEVANNGYGWATWMVDSDGWVAYDTGGSTPVRGERWGTKAGQWTLAKTYYGFLVTGTYKTVNGIDCVRVIQHEVNRGVKAKIDAPITAGSSGTVSVHTSAWVDTTINVTATNDFSDLDTINTKVYIEEIGGEWSIYAAGC